MGTMYWPPNIEAVLWFSQEVWPVIIKRIPKAKFIIIGKNPPRSIQELGSSNHHSEESSHDTLSSNGYGSIHVTGYVKDPQPYLEKAGVFIVPLLSGGGMRVKIIDAWRWGLPMPSFMPSARDAPAASGASGQGRSLPLASGVR